MPSIDPVFGKACRASMAPDIQDRLHVVDNSGGSNLGVSASWNQGIDRALESGADWLVIVSESIRFGDRGGHDFENGLTGEWVLAACDQTCRVDPTGAGFCQGGYGWHLTALSRALIERVGHFDEVYYPAWFEDADYSYRMILTGTTHGVRLTGIDAHLVACEHSTAAGLVEGTFYTTRPFFDAKWGGPPGHECFTHPYNDPALSPRDVTRTLQPWG